MSETINGQAALLNVNASSELSSPSFGEKLVGLNFNPSGDDKVSKAKRLCADLADLLKEDWNDSDMKTQLYGQLHVKAMGDILDAQMNVVKVLTLKY